MYQVYPRSFSDSDGDGVGDLPGLTAWSDHLAGLGVDVVWLSPVYALPQDDNGQDISDYQAIDPVFGTLADLDAALVAGLHDRGMKLIMDLGGQPHLRRASVVHRVPHRPGQPKRDWCWWRPARPGHDAGTTGAEPTNWGSAFSGPAGTLDPAGGEYYLHSPPPSSPISTGRTPRSGPRCTGSCAGGPTAGWTGSAWASSTTSPTTRRFLPAEERGPT
jgi:oligo-1,6-glucosidase